MITQEGWVQFSEALGLDPSRVFTPVIAGIVFVFVVFMLGIFPGAYLYDFFVSKFTADSQARIGPNHAGFYGALQPLMNLLKKNFRKKKAEETTLFEKIANALMVSIVVVIPFGSLLGVQNQDVSVFLPIGLVLLVSFLMVLSKISIDDFEVRSSGERYLATTLASIAPVLFSTLAVGVHVGGYRWSEVAQQQGFFPWLWMAFQSPFQLIAFVCFWISSRHLIVSKGPDNGFYGGYLQFIWATLCVLLFLGGWSMPDEILIRLKAEGWTGVIQLSEGCILFIKIMAILIFSKIVTRASIKSNSKQTSDMLWTFLTPLSIVSFLGAVLWRGWVKL